MPLTAPVFCCGFECGLTPHWTSVTNIAIDTTTKRSGARSARVNISASTAGASVDIPTNTTFALRFYINFTTLPNTTAYILKCTGPTPFTTRGGVYFNSSDNKLYAGVGTDATTPSATSSTGIAVSTATWYRVDFKLNVSANPWTADLQVDGSATTQVTTGLAAATLGRIVLGINVASTTADFYYDDLVVSATPGDYPIGAGFINHFISTSDGTHNIAGTGDFQRGNTAVDILNATTTAYQLIDDVPMKTSADSVDSISAIAPLNATDYTETIFGPASGISTPTVAPRAVEAIVATHQAATQTGSFKTNLNDNGTVGLIKEQVGVAGVTTIAYATKQFATAPTGGAWTVVSGAGNFNNLRLRFYSADAAPDQFLDSAMIEAEFAPLVTRIPKPISIGHPFIF